MATADASLPSPCSSPHGRRPEAVAAARRHRRRGRRRRRRGAVVAGPEPTACCTATSRATTRRRSSPGAGGRRHSSTSSTRHRRHDGAAEQRISDARLKLAAQGLPATAAASELIRKDPGFGVSQFMENARYQHALEVGTGAHHHQPADGRGRARAPRDAAQLGVRARPRPGSASVFVKLRPGRRLEAEQVQRHRQPRGLQHSRSSRPTA